ncbi:MAG TPA: triose-phosphate isomerase [Gemmatimonadales bacterium]|nr:triose-phosphate isomerase [Gemmatimonadales bacterium]
MPGILYAANWKMHLGPTGAAGYVERFVARVPPSTSRELWFFPPAVSLPLVARAFQGREDVLVGAQDAHWESKGAYTGAISMPMVRDAGGRTVLVGHSERRHVFGETEAETGRKVRAALESDLVPLLCVGEKLEERDAGRTASVVVRQLAAALDGLGEDGLVRVVVAYEPVWAIGTGRNAHPADAAEVHAVIRDWLVGRGAPADTRILYGGSVRADNVVGLLAAPGVDGVLVGGASLDPDGWALIVGGG